MRARWLHGLTAAAVLLSACAQASGAPVVSTAKPTVRQSVPATGAGVWFAPEPAQAHDLLALVESSASWSHAAAATAVFQLSASSIAALSDADLAALSTGLKRAGLPIAVLLPALTPVSGCGSLPKTPDASTAPDLLRRLKGAGADVRFIAMDRPASAGSQCGLSAMEIATNVGAFSTSARTVFPQAGIGDAELLSVSADGSSEAAWMQAYATVTGSPLAFLHLDLDWSIGDWPAQLRQLASLVRQSGGGLGIVDRGNLDDASDELWTAHAADRMAAVASAGIQVDSAIFQSSAAHSPRLLPESDGATFTALVARAAGTRTVLGMDRPSTASDGSEVAGARLVDASGSPIGGAPVELTVRSLNARGDFAQYRQSGIVPADAGRAMVAIRVDTENADPGPADLSLYRASYKEGSAGPERVPDPGFAEGMAHWTSDGLVRLEPSDRGTGQMLRLTDNPPQPLIVNSGEFAVTPGAGYTVTFDARVAPVSRGYFAILFLGSTEVPRVLLRFNPTTIHLQAVSDATGRLQWRIPAAALPAELDVRYPGDRTRWPASVITS